MQTMSQAEYARHRGVTRAAVSQAIKSGRITLEADGNVDPETADDEWSANTQENQIGDEPRDDYQNPEKNKERAAQLAEWRMRREKAVAMSAELDLRQRMGELVEVFKVDRELTGIFAGITEALETMADRLAPSLAGLSDVNDVHRELREESRKVLRDLHRRVSDE